MAIPDFQSLMLPVLQESAAGEVRIADVVAILGRKLSLSADELSELLPSGKQTTFANRVNWAKSYLGKAGLKHQRRFVNYQIRFTHNLKGATPHYGERPIDCRVEIFP